jgi:hypothetical protein
MARQKKNSSVTSSRSGVRPITSPSSCPLRGTRLLTVLQKPRSSESNTSWRRLMGLHRFLAQCWPYATLPWPTGECRQLKHSSNRTCASRTCRRCPPIIRRRRQLLFDAVVQHCVKEVGTVPRRASPQSSVVRMSVCTIQTPRDGLVVPPS